MKILPNQPNLDFLRREARAIRARHRAGDTSVCEVIGHFDTSMHGLSTDEVLSKKFSIIDAQRVTARQYAFSSWSRLKLFVEKSSTTNHFNKELSQSILKRERIRNAYFKRFKKTNWKDNDLDQWEAFNSETGDMFKDIYQQHGWPGPDLIGRQAVEASFYLVASNTHDANFQRRSAQLMKEALPKGECFGTMYASIIDRYLALTYQPTVYGTTSDFNQHTRRVELSKNVIDPENLNIRRAQAGPPDFDTHNREAIEQQTKRGQLQTDREDWEQYKRTTALKGGYIQPQTHMPEHDSK